MANGWDDTLFTVDWDDPRLIEKVMKTLRAKKAKAEKTKRWFTHAPVLEDEDYE